MAESFLDDDEEEEDNGNEEKNNGQNKELNIFEQLDNMNDKSNNNNNNNSNIVNINEDNKINNNNNTGTEERIILAISKEENQDSLDRLKKLDELSTVMDQSIITEEEMNAMEQARKDEIKSIIQKEKMDRKHLADHRMIWEESLGWNEEKMKKIMNNIIIKIIMYHLLMMI